MTWKSRAWPTQGEAARQVLRTVSSFEAVMRDQFKRAMGRWSGGVVGRCAELRSWQNTNPVEAAPLAQNRVNDAVGHAAGDCGLEWRPCRSGQVGTVFHLIDRVRVGVPTHLDRLGSSLLDGQVLGISTAPIQGLDFHCRQGAVIN